MQWSLRIHALCTSWVDKTESARLVHQAEIGSIDSDLGFNPGLVSASCVGEIISQVFLGVEGLNDGIRWRKQPLASAVCRLYCVLG